ncbi:MAG: branched-chain amino acid transferase [Rhodospirillaceae bacterium]|nr:branched-chain amino acid transferase [Rhodospirillaceae bacterium]
MSDGIVFIDGKYVRPEEARMSIFDSGFVWGDVVYDVTSAWKRWIFKIDEHLERFHQSIEGFRLVSPYSVDEMRRIIAECVERAGLEDAYIKMQMTRGVIPSQTRDPRLGDCQFVAYATPYAWIWGEEKCRNGVNLYLSSIERVSSKAIDQRFKNYDRADLVQSRFEAYDHGCDDSLLCGPDGNLTEGPGYNVFVVRAGKVSTPDSNILEGITRRSVRELCETEGIPYEERKVHPDELNEAEEIFCSTTAGGVMPVTQLDSRLIGNGHKGILTSRIQELYWRKREEGWHGTRVEDVLNG